MKEIPHEQMLERAKEIMTQERRTTWQKQDYSMDDHLFIYDLDRGDCEHHLMRAMRSVLAPKFPNDPPSRDIIKKITDEIEVHVFGFEDIELYPNVRDHLPFMQEVYAAVAHERRLLWARDDLTVPEYRDLYPFEDGNYPSFQTMKFLHNYFKRTSHPIDPPSYKEFFDAKVEAHEMFVQ